MQSGRQHACCLSRLGAGEASVDEVPGRGGTDQYSIGPSGTWSQMGPCDLDYKSIRIHRVSEVPFRHGGF